jgi:hypothetical protein
MNRFSWCVVLSYRTAVINEYLAQIAEPGVDFSNSAKWCPQAQYSDGDNMFRTAMWVSKMIYAYDYLLAGDQVHGQSLSQANKDAIQAWLLSAATFYEALHNVGLGQIIVDRKAGNYNFTSYGNSECNTDFNIPYYGAPPLKNLVAWFHNRRATFPLVYGLVGVQQNNATLKNEASRAFQEYLRFGVLPDGTPGSFKRWASTNPGLGWVYAATAWGTLLQVADAFGRAGNTSLYDDTTGLGACGTAGGNKGLSLVLNELAKYLDPTYLRYTTNQVANTTNSNYLIDTNDEVANNLSVYDHVIAQANLYYKTRQL